MEINASKKVFDNFAKDFKQDKNIKIKINHTYHVVDLSLKIAKMMELNEEDTNIISHIALLHDVGRFIQYQKHDKYDDYKTGFDYAKAGSDYLFLEDGIKDYNIDSKYYDIIKFAIENHNKLKIDKCNNNKKYIFYAKLIRDIDKIDIFRVLASNDYDDFKDQISKEVKKLFDSKKIIPLKSIKNKSDSFIYHLSYVFDINFKESFELLKASDNLELYLGSLDVSRENEQEFKEIKDKILKYIEKRVL